MAVGFTLEIPTKVAPHRLFRAGTSEMQNLAPLVMPGIFSDAKVLVGDGSAGSVKHFSFVEGVLPYTYFKEYVEVYDEEKLESVFRITEGADIGTKVSSAVYKMKLFPTEDGGCIFKMSSEYDILPGVDADEYLNGDKEQYILQFKVIEGYLLQNPDVYA